MLNIPFWDNPKTGLALCAHGINPISAHPVKKSIYSDKSTKLQELLVKARTDAGLTQQELAKKLGKHQSFVAKYEGGERRLDMVEFIEICQVIGVDATKLITRII